MLTVVSNFQHNRINTKNMKDHLISILFITIGIIGLVYFLKLKNKPSNETSLLSSEKYYGGIVGSIGAIICGILFLLQNLKII